MKQTTTSQNYTKTCLSCWYFVAALLLFITLLPCSGQAQSGFNVQHFRPSPYFGKTVTLYPTGEGALLDQKHSWIWDFQAGLYMNYQNDAFVSRTNTNTLNQRATQQDLLSLNFLGAVQINNWLAFGLDFPLHPIGFGFTFNPTTGFDVLGDSSNFVVGDLHATLRASLLRQEHHKINLALIASLLLPTGEEEKFLGDEDVQGGLTVAVERRFSRKWQVTGNLGFESRKHVQYFNLNLDDHINYGVGATYDLLPDLDLITELKGIATSREFFSSADQTPLEWLFAGRFLSFGGIATTIGVSFGLIDGYGTSDVRFIAGLHYSSAVTKRVYNDEDGDGIVDRRDACPTIPEDLDGVLDDDGCPEDYSIKITVTDKKGNAIPSKVTIDPALKEGRSFTGSTVVPVEKPGLYKVFVEDGPEFMPQSKRVVIAPDDIQVELRFVLDPTQEGGSSLELVRTKLTTQFAFDSSEIPEASYDALDDFAQSMLKSEKDYTIQLNGHADATGPSEYNQKLSERRADSVKGYLENKGVDGTKMSTQGFGEAQPIAGNDSLTGRAANRRVEIIASETDKKTDTANKGE